MDTQTATMQENVIPGLDVETGPRHEIQVYGNTYKVEVGSYIEPERWSIGNRLEASAWDRAQFYLPTNSGGPIKQVAVNVEITGRTLQRRPGGSLWIKVRIEFVQDDSPSTFTPGWLLAVR